MWEIVFHLAVACDVYDSVFLCCPFSHEMSWIIESVSEGFPRRLFCFGSLVILDVARCYLWLFTLYINIKISKNSC